MVVSDTIAMANSSNDGDVSGMICDGASNSCAMKVSPARRRRGESRTMALDDTARPERSGIVAQCRTIWLRTCVPALAHMRASLNAADRQADHRDYTSVKRINNNAPACQVGIACCLDGAALIGSTRYQPDRALRCRHPA